MSLRKLLLNLNTWIFKNMNKVYLWMMIYLAMSGGIAMYQINHPLNLTIVLFFNIFLLYGSYKIIFR